MSEDDSKKPVGKVPEGMVRKRRKVRRKRRSKDSSASANKVFAKGKDILFGMQQNEEEVHLDVAEQLRRLKKDADDDKPLDDVWGTKRRSSSWLWIVLLGIIMPMIVIGIIISKLNQKPKEETGYTPDDQIGINEDIFSASDGIHGWFLGDSEVVLAKVISILNDLNKAKTLEEVMVHIRDSPYRKLNPVSLGQFSNPFIAETISDFKISIAVSKPGGVSESEARGILVIDGKHADGKAFTAYFVEEMVDGKPTVQLDWEATSGWGEMTISELIETKPRKEALIRCHLEKKAIYDVEFGDYVYSGYVISNPENGDYTFAYVPLSDERHKTLDSHLKGALDYGNFFLPLRQDQPVTIRVRFGNEDGSSKIFEIISLEHESWVRP